MEEVKGWGPALPSGAGGREVERLSLETDVREKSTLWTVHKGVSSFSRILRTSLKTTDRGQIASHRTPWEMAIIECSPLMKMETSTKYYVVIKNMRCCHLQHGWT